MQICVVSSFCYELNATIIVPGNYKLLVGLGSINGGDSSGFEVIDIDSMAATKTCQNLPNGLSLALGALDLRNKPLICGGWSGTSAINGCKSFDGNDWVATHSLNSGKTYAAMSPSPYPSRSQSLFVTGGWDGFNPENRSEVLTDDGWEIVPPLLPVPISAHCSVLINATTLMIIGGNQVF